MRIKARQRKICTICDQDMHPPVYALQHFYVVVGRYDGDLSPFPHTDRTVQVVTRGTICWSCVYSGLFRAEVTRGYAATRARILEIAELVRQGDELIDRTALFYEPLWYTPPVFWDI